MNTFDNYNNSADENNKCDLCGRNTEDITLSLGQYICSKCEETFNIYYSIEDTRVFRKDA